MDKAEFLQKLREEMEAGIWMEEFEVSFLNDELGKLEDDINRSSRIIYPTGNEKRKELGRLQQEKSALQVLIKQREGSLEIRKTKLEFLSNLL